jgi:hypothetical protein
MDAAALPPPGASSQRPNHKQNMNSTIRFLIKDVSIPLACAAIAYFGAVQKTRDTATSAAKETAETTATSVVSTALRDQQQLISGGQIKANGNIELGIGRQFSISKDGVGVYRIQFRDPFDHPPVTLVSARTDAVSTIGRFDSSDPGSVRVMIRRLPNEAPVDAPFTFYVLESTRVVESK